MEYKEFIDSKKIKPVIAGFDIEESALNANLFDFQRVIVKWALKRGRAAIFADTGLGKTLMQSSWAQEVVNHTYGDVLIFAPLCVANQTVNEGKKFGIEINYCRDQDGIKSGINITNYEMMNNFDLSLFAGVVLDESSIIKNRDGKTRNAIIEGCKVVPYRLSCTATPSPNDFMELGNQVEFLGIMTMTEMLAMYFVNDAGDTGTWILKGHGKAKFWEWMATWAVCIRSPEDIGFDGSKYILPKLNMIGHVVESATTFGLFADVAQGLLERNQARRDSIDDRVAKCAEVVNASSEQFFIWCHLNDEAAMIEKMIPDAVDVSGSDSIEHKEESIGGFIDGSIRVLVSKPKILGAGMNFQHCHNTAFVGLSDSWEQYYQAIRRFYRFGQTKEVNVHIISAESEGAVVENIRRKELQNEEMGSQMVKHMSTAMKKEIFGMSEEKSEYVRDVVKTADYELHLADCVELASEIEDGTIDYTIFSPPFESMYVFSNHIRDMGNSTKKQFYQHFRFLVDEMLRITRPGRLLSFHCMNLPTSKVNDGYIGIRDFRGDLIRMFQEAGWIYHSEVCIWKDPVVAMQRTKALGLLHKTIRKDSSMSRQGIADYLVTMRKPGQNDKAVRHYRDAQECEDICKTEKLDYEIECKNILEVGLWQKYASPVWMDINQSRTLNFKSGRDDDDQKHICPLQLDVIERAMHLWTAPNDLVFSPFTGVGSEGYVAVEMGRRFIGSELKQSYFDLAKKNMQDAKKGTMDLF
ncbi:MAG: DNA methyltransferase [Bacillota bacterium]|nr:DNA methyltransferase [Bacillota bacterium]